MGGKGYVKHVNQKHSSYIKKPVGYHKKNKSQHNSRIMPARANSSLSSYNFNTNRSNISKYKKDPVIHNHNSGKKISMKSMVKNMKKSSSRYPQYQHKTDHYLKNHPISKKISSSNHVRNASANCQINAKTEGYKRSAADKVYI